jgi:hypothetical protein
LRGKRFGFAYKFGSFHNANAGVPLFSPAGRTPLTAGIQIGGPNLLELSGSGISKIWEV